MKIKEKKKPDGKIIFDVKVNSKEVDNAFSAAYQMFAQSVGLHPKPGKTIQQLAKEELGIGDLDSMARDYALEALVPFAVDKSGLLPAYPPRVLKCSPLRRGSEANFQMELTPKTRYELTSYDPVEISVPAFSVDEELVERQIREIAERNPVYERATAQHEVRKGDAVLLEMESFERGERLPGLSTQARTYVTGEGYMPAGFDEQIIGMKPGETKSFSFQGPDLESEDPTALSTVDATVTIIEIQEENVPVIDDAWLAKNMPVFKSVEELRANIRHTVEAKAREDYDARCRQMAVFQMTTRFKGSIPDEAYEAMQDNIRKDLKQQLKAQGMTLKDYIEQQGGEQQFSMMMMMRVRDMLVQGYVLDSVFAHEKLELEDADYLAAARTINPEGDPAQTRKRLESTGCKFILRENAERLKAADYLLEHAIIKEHEAE